MPGVDRKDLFQILVPSPPTHEQPKIVAWIESKSEVLRKSISTTRGEIDLLREYRTRLIADVVTGKLDVREAASCLPDESDRSDLSDTSDESELDAGGEDNLAGEASAEETS